MNLAGKSVLITGGRRVGSDLARLLAGRRMSIGLTYHTSRAAIEQTVAEIEAGGGRAMAIEADLSRADQAAQAVDAVAAAFGGIDVLVNMASIYRRTPLATLVPEDFDAMIATNLATAYHTSLAAVRRMREGEWPATDPESIRGKIVLVGDWATERPYPDYLPYLVAKGALKTLTLALARELAPQITVNLVQPAMIEAPSDFTAQEIAAVAAATPLKRIGEPGDVNRLILYLLEGTDFATGSCYRVDGGRFLHD
jgi:pteridine reductase